MRAFAIIPAGGQSRRMGRPKLLLPWGDGLLVDGVVRAWQKAGVDAVVAVVHPQDVELARHLEGCGVEVVVPDAPPAEMKDSVRLALEHIKSSHRPNENDVWLLAPADMPNLSADVARRVIQSAVQHTEAIIVPTHEGNSGHPASFPWRLADEVESLADDEGVNSLLGRQPVIRIECGRAALASDVDTPDDYDRLKQVGPA